ncbi:MFS transporter [Actinoplanes sp. NPDC048796]|uniref:MFS transporter n=1 Tax=Actinoplanes sp. NPDC048796 TaxID=3155640 RepID=UPI0033D6BA0E
MSIAAGLWVLDLTGSVSFAALTAVCLYLPTFAGPWLGVLVDRLPRRPLLIGADVALGGVLLTLLTVHSAGGVWLIFAVLLFRGVVYVVSDAGETAILPSALPKAMLGDVNGWRSSAQEGMKLVAPLAGAALYAWRGVAPVILMSAAIPLLTAACYAALRVTSVIGEATARHKGGLTALFRIPEVRTPVVVAGIAIGMSGLCNAAVLAHLVRDLSLPSTYLGFLATAQGAGSIAGGLIVGRLLARGSPVAVAAYGSLVFAAGCLSSSLPWWPAMITGSVLIGVGLPWALIAGITAVQTSTPDHLLGRVGATSTTVMFGPVALGIPLGSVLIHLGTVLPLWIAAAVTVTAAVLVRRRHPAAQPAVSSR